MDNDAEILDDHGFAMTAHTSTTSHIPCCSALAYVPVFENVQADLLRVSNIE